MSCRRSSRKNRDAHLFIKSVNRCASPFVVAMVLAACSIEPPPPDRFFRIAVAPPAAAASAGFRVQVEPVEAAGLYTERPLVFERDGNGGALEQYHYYFWTESPDLLLVDALIH